MLFAKCPFEDVTIPRLMFQIQTKQVNSFLKTVTG